MGNPFRDKFLKAGLVSKKQAKKAKHENRISKKQGGKTNPSEKLSRVKQEQAAQKKRNQELNRQNAEKMQQKERLAQIRQLIEQNRLEKDERGEAYYFAEENKIQRIFVSDELVDQLSRGQTAIVKLDNGYEVVPVKVARQIAKRDKDTVLVLHEGKS